MGKLQELASIALCLSPLAAAAVPANAWVSNFQVVSASPAAACSSANVTMAADFKSISVVWNNLDRVNRPPWVGIWPGSDPSQAQLDCSFRFTLSATAPAAVAVVGTETDVDAVLCEDYVVGTLKEEIKFGNSQPVSVPVYTMQGAGEHKYYHETPLSGANSVIHLSSNAQGTASNTVTLRESLAIVYNGPVNDGSDFNLRSRELLLEWQ